MKAMLTSVSKTISEVFCSFVSFMSDPCQCAGAPFARLDV
jgi:hypothetical protein